MNLPKFLNTKRLRTTSTDKSLATDHAGEKEVNLSIKRGKEFSELAKKVRDPNPPLKMFFYGVGNWFVIANKSVRGYVDSKINLAIEIGIKSLMVKFWWVIVILIVLVIIAMFVGC